MGFRLMKILHVIANISPRYGGPAQVCKDICKYLAGRRQYVEIYTTNLDYPDGILNVPKNKPVEQDGYTVNYFSVQFKPYAISIPLANKLQWDIKKFDIIHIHGLYRFPQAIAAFYARKHKIPYIVMPHGSLDPFLFHRNKRRFLKRVYEKIFEFRNLNHASRIHFTTEEEMMLTHFLKLKASAMILPNGLNPQEFAKLPPYGVFRKKYGLKDEKIILHLGRLNFKKGIDILVKAFGRIAKNDSEVRLVLAGPDNDGYSQEVMKWVVQEDVQEKVIFTGMLLGEHKLSVLRDADIFVLPSYSENFGIAVIEAMVCGLPVVISDKVNIWREVEASGAGLVTDCDYKKVSEALLFLLGNSEKRIEMGKLGQKMVREKYNWDSLTEELINIYHEVINEKLMKNNNII